MSITEAIALWIKARADRLAHRHEWVEVDRGSPWFGELSTSFICKTCDKAKVVKTY